MQGPLNWIPEKQGPLNSWIRGGRVLIFLLAAGVASVPCDFGQTSGAPSNSAQPKQSIINPAANRPPDKNEQMEMREQHAKRANYEKANAERKRQLMDDSEALLVLATELKQEVDKTTEDTLSSEVSRKSEDIAKLAHDVQVKMKLTVNAAY